MIRPKGFHGDDQLLKIVDYLANKSETYIETGTHVGHTFNYVSKTYPHLHCYGCEPVVGRYKIAKRKVSKIDQVQIYNETSQKFLKRLGTFESLTTQTCLFWLDAHSKQFKWPLKEEISFCTRKLRRAFILIDDFKVPNNPQFRFNKYGKQRYTLSYIQAFFNPQCHLQVYFPKYGSNLHKGAKTGWCLLQIGLKINVAKKFPKLVFKTRIK